MLPKGISVNFEEIHYKPLRIYSIRDEQIGSTCFRWCVFDVLFALAFIKTVKETGSYSTLINFELWLINGGQSIIETQNRANTL